MNFEVRKVLPVLVLKYLLNRYNLIQAPLKRPLRTSVDKISPKFLTLNQDGKKLSQRSLQVPLTPYGSIHGPPATRLLKNFKTKKFLISVFSMVTSHREPTLISTLTTFFALQTL